MWKPCSFRCRAARATIHFIVAVSVFGDAEHAAANGSAGAIFPLGTPGGIRTYGLAVNEGGQVAGNIYASDELSNRAFLYAGPPTDGSVVFDLGLLGGTHSWGFALNDSGQVVGGSEIPADNGVLHAFLYTGAPGHGGAMADLGTLGGYGSFAYGINNLARIVGTSQTTAALDHAFLYVGTPGSGGAMADLGTLGGTFSAANAINDIGQITGTSATLTTRFRAFLYAGIPGSGGTMTDLGALGGPESESQGNAINKDGQVAGSSNTASGGWHAFLYSGAPGRGGAMADLGTLGGHESFANDINARGQIVGTSEIGVADRDDVRHAFIYSGTPGNGGQMTDLNTWLAAHNPIEAAKWTLYVANGISDNGLITGAGLYDDGPGGLSDGYCAFVLDAHALVPEPSSFTLIGFGLIIVAVQNHHRSNCRFRRALR